MGFNLKIDEYLADALCDVNADEINNESLIYSNDFDGFEQCIKDSYFDCDTTCIFYDLPNFTLQIFPAFISWSYISFCSKVFVSTLF